jgi:hypothetical protein
MKMPKSVIAGLGVLVLGASALVQAAPPDQRGDDRGGPQGQHEQRGDDHRGPQDNRRGGPPQDFGPVRQIIHDNHGQFSRGAPPPPNVRLVAAGRCPTATTANASTTAPWRACRFTRVTNGAVRARTWC